MKLTHTLPSDVKKIAVIFPKDSEGLFNKHSTRTFGGASVQMYNISKELSNNRNLEIYSFVPSYKKINFNESKWFNLIKTFNESDNVLKKILTFHRKVREINPDCIINHGLSVFSCLLARYCKFYRIKYIFMFASDKEVEGRYQNSGRRCRFFKTLLRNSSILVSQNEYQKNKLLENYHKSSDILYNGFEINKNTERRNYVLWVSRCDKLKCPELFIELAKSFPREKFIMVCPRSHDKKYFRLIMKMAKNVKNLKFIEFVHFSKINVLFKRAKVFVNTSDYEGFPQTFIQSTMNSVPVLSLNVNPDNFLDKHGCGYCAGGDTGLMNELLNKLLSDSGLRKKIGEDEYRYARDNHDIKKMITKLIKIID